MPKIKGTQIRNETVTGDQILNESIDESDIKDGSIKAAELSNEAITGQTLHSGSTDDSNDMLLIYDHSNTALRKIPLGDLMGPAGVGDAIEDADQDTRISVDNGFDEDKIRFDVAGSEAVIIDNNGRLGINTSEPDYKLDVAGNVGLNEYIYHNGDSDTHIRFQNNQLDFVAGGQIASFSSNILNIAGSIIPNTDAAYDLGSTLNVWNNIYGNNGTVNDLTVLNNLTLSGSDISFSDNNDTYPTSSGGFFWDLNNDEARIYAEQPGSDQISLYFKLSDNSNTSNDRYVFWHHDYQGTSYHRYPLVMYGESFYIHSPPSGTSGVPDLSNAKVTIPNGTSSGTTTTHKGRVFLNGDNTSDLYIRFQNNTENAYLFQDQSDSNTFKLESANSIAFNTGGPSERMRISSSGDITVEQDFEVNGSVISTEFKSTGDMDINAAGGDIRFKDNGSTVMVIEDGGNVGIGSLITNPSYHLHLKKSTTAPIIYIDNVATDDTDFIYARSSLDVDPDSGSFLIRWVDNAGDSLYYVRGNGSGGSSVSTSFTAGHDTVIDITQNLLPGMIIESTGEVWYKPTDKTFDTGLPKCRLSSSAMSNKVFGVIGGQAGHSDDSKALIESGGKIINGYLQAPAFKSYGRRAVVEDGEVHLNTMSIGEGVVWVTNIAGEVKNGDLICSSDILGHGQLQSDDIMRSITVAKCTESIDWSSVSDTIQHNGVAYKKYMSMCTFHCG